MVYLFLLLFLASCVGMYFATWHGAHLCQEEAARAGQPKLWGTSKAWGLKPQNWRVYALAGFVAAVFAVLMFTGHPKIAGEFAKDAGILVSGIAGATWWAGCC